MDAYSKIDLGWGGGPLIDGGAYSKIQRKDNEDY